MGGFELQRHQGMLHVDDLIEPGPEKILLSRLASLPWSHFVSLPKQSKASESQIKFARNRDPKARFPANPVTAKRRFQIPNQRLGISSRTTTSCVNIAASHRLYSQIKSHV
jgi:hypothetical protein